MLVFAFGAGTSTLLGYYISTAFLSLDAIPFYLFLGVCLDGSGVIPYTYCGGRGQTGDSNGCRKKFVVFTTLYVSENSLNYTALSRYFFPLISLCEFSGFPEAVLRELCTLSFCFNFCGIDGVFCVCCLFVLLVCNLGLWFGICFCYGGYGGGGGEGKEKVICCTLLYSVVLCCLLFAGSVF